MIDVVPAASTETPAASPVPDPAIAAEAAKAAAVVPQTWLDTLPVELKSDPTLAKYKTPEEAHKAHIEAVKLIGKRQEGVVHYPGENGKPEEWAAYRKAIGVPEKPDGYAVKLPEGVTVHQETFDAYRAKAYEIGLTPKQAEALVQYDIERASLGQRRMHEASVKQQQEGEKALRTAWGPKYDQHMALIQRFVEEYGGEELIQELELKGTANSPKLLQFLDRFATDYFERGMIKGDAHGTQRTEEIQARLATISGDPDFRNDWNNKVRHDALIAERRTLLDELARREAVKPRV